MKTSFMNKKIALAAGILAVILLISTGVYLYLKTPVHLLAIDVNPSIELRTDRLNRVVSINPVNEDAISMMAGYQLSDRDLETVIEDIVNRMIFFGYLTSDQKNQILITADDTYTSAVILDQVNTAISDYMSERQLEVEVWQQQLTADGVQVDAAHASNVSFGKLAIINELIAAGSGLKEEELTGLSIRDLIAYAVSQGISLEGLIENYNDAISEQTQAASEDADAVSSATTKVDGNSSENIISKAVEDATKAEDAQEESMEDAEDDDEDSVKAADSQEDSDEDADEDSDEDSDHKGNNYDKEVKEVEDGDSDTEDSDYEDASDEDDNDYDIEENDQGEDDNDHEDAYYEDSEDNDSEDQEDGQSYYEEDQDEDNGDQEDQDDDGDRNNWGDDNQRGDDNED